MFTARALVRGLIPSFLLSVLQSAKRHLTLYGDLARQDNEDEVKQLGFSYELGWLSEKLNK